MRAVIVVSGVSGSGKTTVGEALARRLDCPFKEGDDLHPAANVAKMHAGVPLNDADRAPWLDAIAGWITTRIATGEGGVVSCSALKRSYRDRLRLAGTRDLRFVLMDADPATLKARLAARKGHYMPASLLDSQLATLERPAADEDMLDLTKVDDIDGCCRAIEDWLATRPD